MSDEPRKLKAWELARVSKLLADEMRDRQSYPGSVARPIGDPSDIDAIKAALEILYWHAEHVYV